MVSKLPAEWDAILNKVRDCVEETLRAAGERAADFETSFVETSAGRPQPSTPVDLSDRAVRFAGLMQGFDADLQVLEEEIRGLTNNATEARARLAAWQGGAIR